MWTKPTSQKLSSKLEETSTSANFNFPEIPEREMELHDCESQSKTPVELQSTEKTSFQSQQIPAVVPRRPRETVASPCIEISKILPTDLQPNCEILDTLAESGSVTTAQHSRFSRLSRGDLKLPRPLSILTLSGLHAHNGRPISMVENSVVVSRASVLLNEAILIHSMDGM